MSILYEIPRFKFEVYRSSESAFERAFRIEEEEEKLHHVYPRNQRAFDAYYDVLAVRPFHKEALVNLGTLYYNARLFEKAKDNYLLATFADPTYALAFFDLGNVYDELHQYNWAIDCYECTIALVPNYKDAHYNLARAYERLGLKHQSLKHWQTYCRLEQSGPWYNLAKNQIKKILDTCPLRLVGSERVTEMRALA